MRRDKYLRKARRQLWWKDFFSGDNSQVNTTAVLCIILATPVALLSFAILLYDVFYLGKGLTGSAVQLIGILMGAATGSLVGSLYSRTTSILRGTFSGGMDMVTGLPEPPEEIRTKVRPRGR